MKRILILAIACLMGSVLSAQNCYDNLLNKGMKEYNAGNYDKALIKWKAALEDCPELTSTQRRNLNDWIAKAQNPNVITPSVSSSSLQQSYEPEMVFVQGGTFNMGSNDNGNEEPIHSVTISSFYIGKYEITQKQWRDIMGSNPSNFKNCDNCPVESVGWEDAQQFLQKLNAKTGKKYRLPTEAEWEFAARGGTQSKGYTFAGTSNATQLYRYANFCDKNCTEESGADKNQNDGYSNTAPVGKFLSNELGIFDMSGNVWEWCSDWNDSYLSGSQTNPIGASSGDSRVIRGGSWYFSYYSCRVAHRDGLTPTYRYNSIGIRVARYD